MAKIFNFNGELQEAGSRVLTEKNLAESVIDDSIAYNKTVSDNVLSYATVTEIGGMSYKCENLIPFPYNTSTGTIHGVTFTVNNDGSVVANGAVSGEYNAAFYLCDNLMLSAGTYTLSGISSAFGYKATITIYYKNESDEYTYINAYGGEEKTFTLTTSTTCTIYLQILAGQTISNLTFYPMVNVGEIALPYQPYFTGLRDSKVTAIESVGKNIFGGDALANKIKEIRPSAVLNEQTKTIEYDASGVGDKTLFDDFESNTRYTFIFKGKGTAAFLNMTIQYTDGTYDNVPMFSKNNTVETLRFVSDGSRSIASLNGNWNSGSTTLYYENCGIFKGDVVFDNFSSYFCDTVDMPEEVQALEGYGQGVNKDYYNKVVIDPDNFVNKYKRVAKKVTFNGTENWLSGGSPASDYYSFSIAIGAMATTGICSHFDYNYLWGGGSNHFYTDSNGSTYFITNKYTTVDEWKVYLSAQYDAGTPITLCYVLATPEEIDISTYFTDNHHLSVEAGGIITAVNEYDHSVPTTIKYYTSNTANAIIGGKKIVGDLIGNATTADKADSANSADRSVCDTDGNRIDKTYIKLANTTTNSDIVYTKEVPEKSLGYASVTEIGGMSYKCENLIPFPYSFGSSITTNGVTVKANTDGSITLNGTFTASQVVNVDLIGYSDYITLPAGTYRISGIPASGNPAGFVGIICNMNSELETYVFHHTFTITETKKFGLLLQFAVGSSFSNQTLYPMLNVGETALPYQPYFTGLRDSKVTAIETTGRCLIPASAVYKTFATSVQKDGRDCLTFITNTSQRIIPITFKNNTRYTVQMDVCSVKTQSDANSADWIFAFYYTDGTNSIINNASDGVWRTRTRTSDEGKTVCAVGIVIQEYRINNYVDVSSFRFVEGTEIPENCKPYTKITFPIPEEVQALDGYGHGIPNTTYYNKIVIDPMTGAKKFVKNVGCVDLGSLNWSISYSVYVYATINDKSHGVRNFNVSNGEIADSNMTGSWDDNFTPGTWSGSSISSQIVYRMRDADEYSSEEAFKAAMSGVMLLYELATPTETDISTHFTVTNVIGVEVGGTVTAVNEYEYAVPFTIEHYTSDNTDKIFGGKKIVGDLFGTASKATHDGAGNNIIDTYATKAEVRDQVNDLLDEAINDLIADAMAASY